MPVGSDRTWFAPPYTSLGRRFNGSSFLHLLTSQEQRDIKFSLGMMGSPAVGAMLFRLKQSDTTPGGANHDNAYHQLLSERGRMVVAGSAVGGTGASVAPTLARQLAVSGAEVMAVMVLNWFRFDTDGLDDEALGRVQGRTQSMIENANSAFAYYGRDLARRVATVPVGMPPTAVRPRRYTSDTQQPISESFIHGVAALCCLNHFLRGTAFDSGLYQMGAEAPEALLGGTLLPGGDTLQSLANQAATLAEALGVYANVLFTRSSRGLFGRLFDVDPAILTQLDRSGSGSGLERTGRYLGELASEYRKHVEWIRDVLGTDPQTDEELLEETLLREAAVRGRIRAYPIEATGRRENPSEDDALGLFHWTAEWIRDLHEGKSGAVASAAGGYWPPLVGVDSLTASADQAGGLTRVPDQNVQSTVQGFILNDQVTHNGWPDPVAAAEHFRYAIEQGNPTACRQLAMLLVGVVTEELKLRKLRGVQGSDDMTSLGGSGGGFAIGPCRTRISGCAGSGAERGGRLATKLMILALDSGRGRVRPTKWMPPEHPPRSYSLCAATRPRSRHSGDRSAKAAARPAGEGGIQRYSGWRRIAAERHSPRLDGASDRWRAATAERTAGRA